ncbi:hypothetical protein OIO90_000243 [Microbotryomycetes sp. JL221]|nr:hypothetical protein OIO90_000243 [Microbotryomycetes sp. JL221]
MPATVDELRQRESSLGELSLDTRGNKTTLKRRLLNASKHHDNHSDDDDDDDQEPETLTKPPTESFDSFLVLDVEATCVDIKDSRLAFAYPNEIIEWPVVLLQWQKPQSPDGQWHLVKVDEYHSYVKPTWQPQLDPFCTQLTGITQHQVDQSPSFSTLLLNFERDFIQKHDLFSNQNKTCWVTDGPWDLESFVAKTLYMNELTRPKWLGGDMIDLRILTAHYFGLEPSSQRRQDSTLLSSIPTHPPPQQGSRPRPPLNLSLSNVLEALDLGPFQGRLHSGIDDTRNASRILVELQTRGMGLQPNRRISLSRERRWDWMSTKGKVKWNR